MQSRSRKIGQPDGNPWAPLNFLAFPDHRLGGASEERARPHFVKEQVGELLGFWNVIRGVEQKRKVDGRSTKRFERSLGRIQKGDISLKRCRDGRADADSAFLDRARRVFAMPLHIATRLHPR
jgi:hypothetical protein